MKKVAVVSAAFVLALSSTVVAGHQQGGSVVVNRKLQYAGGGLGGARNSPDTVQQIACNVQTTAGSAPLVLCMAWSASGINGNCWSYDPSILAAAQSVSGDSWVDYHWHATSGECTELDVANTSIMEPKR
jgi:hypothetical protein